MDIDTKLDSKLEVEVNGAVVFEFTVVNTGDGDVELSFSDTQEYDFAVFDGSEEVWRWSEDMMFAQMIQSEVLEPRDSLTYEESWGSPQKGDYEVVATLEANNVVVEERESFSV